MKISDDLMASLTSIINCKLIVIYAQLSAALIKKKISKSIHFSERFFRKICLLNQSLIFGANEIAGLRSESDSKMLM